MDIDQESYIFLTTCEDRVRSLRLVGGEGYWTEAIGKELKMR
jgi:hypothetical protein